MTSPKLKNTFKKFKNSVNRADRNWTQLKLRPTELEVRSEVNVIGEMTQKNRKYSERIIDGCHEKI